MKPTQLTSVTSSIRLSLYAFALASVFALTACGGGSGTPAATTPPPSGNPPGGGGVVATEAALSAKTRDLPGATVTVTSYSMSDAPTVVSRVQVSVSDATAVTGVPAVTLGTDFDTGTTATATATGTGTWSIAVPANLAAGTGVQLNFTLSSGDGYETGVKDFIIK